MILLQEIIRYNQLLTLIRTSLLSIQMALNGLAIIDIELEDVVNSLIIGRLPLLWSTKSYPTLKSLGSYINDLCDRCQFFKVI
jgi:dynein heavy chain